MREASNRHLGRRLSSSGFFSDDIMMIKGEALKIYITLSGTALSTLLGTVITALVGTILSIVAATAANTSTLVGSYWKSSPSYLKEYQGSMLNCGMR